MAELFKNIGIKEILGAILFLGGLYGSNMKSEYDNKFKNAEQFYEVSKIIEANKTNSEKEFINLKDEIKGVKNHIQYLENKIDEK